MAKATGRNKNIGQNMKKLKANEKQCRETQHNQVKRETQKKEHEAIWRKWDY